MSDAAAILTTFANWRPVPSRKVLQLVFEIPIEQQGDVLTRLGPPDTVNPVWCGIALVDPALLKEQAPQARSSSSPSNRNEEPPADAGLDRERTPWRDLPPANQAGIRCAEPAFQNFLNGISGRHVHVHDKDSAARFVRDYCGVYSRADFAESAEARARWAELDRQYEQWVRS